MNFPKCRVCDAPREISFFSPCACLRSTKRTQQYANRARMLTEAADAVPRHMSTRTAPIVDWEAAEAPNMSVVTTSVSQKKQFCERGGIFL